MNEPQLQDLIAKYLNGTASSLEKQELLRWYRSTGTEESELPFLNSGESDEAGAKILANLNKQIDSERSIPAERSIAPRRIAAAITALLIGSGIFYFIFQNN